MKYLKAHWGAIMSVAGTAIYFLAPSLQAYVHLHPNSALGVILASLLTMFYSKSPRQGS